jgi:hypothetical protein
MPTARQPSGSEFFGESPALGSALRGPRPSDLAVHPATKRMHMEFTPQLTRLAPPSGVNALVSSTSASEAVARTVAFLQAEDLRVCGALEQQVASYAECGEKLCSELDAELRVEAERRKAVLLGNLQVLAAKRQRLLLFARDILTTMNSGIAERIGHEGRIFSEAAYALETIEADVAEARAQLESMSVASE